MRHHGLVDERRFVVPPERFDRSSDPELLRFALGATLYTPGTREIAHPLLAGSLPGLTSLVICLEDAVAEKDLAAAEDNTLAQLALLSDVQRSGAAPEIPFLFIRARDGAQLARFAARLQHHHADVLVGFVFPKFTALSAATYFETLRELNARLGVALFAMPILEGPAIAHRETRDAELHALHATMETYRSDVLNIRIGGTDLSSLFGLRRDMRASIYDLLPVRDALSDIVNVFNRPSDGYVISGPVWEYFLAYKRDDLAELLEREEDWHLGPRTKPILNAAVDGLIRETLLDKVNGLVGKTVIHPSHVRLVNALQAVTREEYEDASQILASSGGVMKSSAQNKMNETNPHRNWARRIMMLSRAYGVVETQRDLLGLAL